MVHIFPRHGVTLKLADSWTVQAVSQTMLVVHPIAYSAPLSMYVAESVCIVAHRACEPLKKFAFGVMRERRAVTSLYHEESELAGRPALIVTWTDGVLDLESVFTTNERGQLYELLFTGEVSGSPTPMGLRPKLSASLADYVQITLHAPSEAATAS